MKLALMSNDIDLHKEFERKEYMNVSITTNLDDINNYNVVVISDRIINYNELSIKFDRKELENRYIFYMLSNDYTNHAIDNIKSISKALDIIIIPPKLAVSQIVDRVIEIVFPNLNDKSNKIITFFGADSKVGTTMITQSTAEMLARNTKSRIGLFFLNGNPSNFYMKKKDKIGIDDIKIKLFNNILSADELLSACTLEETGVFILSGIDNILEARHYHPEHINNLIKLASERFNLILIDAGSNLDSGLAIASLNATTKRYLVTTQQEVARKNYERYESQVFNRLQINSSDFMLIVNKYIKSNNIYNATQIANLYNMPLATYVSNLGMIGWQAEFDHKSLLEYGDEQYNKQIDHLAKLIATQAELIYRKDNSKNNNFIKKAFSNIGGYM